jgi:hypothetical protein
MRFSCLDWPVENQAPSIGEDILRIKFRERSYGLGCRKCVSEEHTRIAFIALQWPHMASVQNETSRIT